MVKISRVAAGHSNTGPSTFAASEFWDRYLRRTRPTKNKRMTREVTTRLADFVRDEKQRIATELKEGQLPVPASKKGASRAAEQKAAVQEPEQAADADELPEDIPFAALLACDAMLALAGGQPLLKKQKLAA